MIVLVTRDSHGNALTSGDHAVSFTRMSGARRSVGRLLGAVDRGNGRYSPVNVGDSLGTQDMFGVVIDGRGITSALADDHAGTVVHLRAPISS